MSSIDYYKAMMAPPILTGATINFYNTFTVLLNMVDFTQYKSVVPPGDYFVLLYFHGIYVFIMPISLINFLIALLSTAVAEVMENKPS